MFDIITRESKDSNACLVLLAVTVLYLIFHYGVPAERIARKLNPARSEEQNGVLSVYLQRILGGLILGLGPAALIVWRLGGSPKSWGLGAGHGTYKFALGIPLLALPFVYSSVRKMLSEYPQVRATTWDLRMVVLNAGTWGIYLLGYEFFFRGFFLLSMRTWSGVLPALCITTMAYVFVHLPKNAGECTGTLLMGFVFGIAELRTGAIWAPFLAHWCIAVSSDMFALRANPKLRYVGGWSLRANRSS